MASTDPLRASDLVDDVLAPDAAACLGASPLRVLDTASLPKVDPRRARAAAERLGFLPAVFVALVDGEPVPDHPLVGACTTVAGPHEIAAIGARVAANPEAAIVLHHLLAATERATVPDALVMESLAYSTLLGGAEFARWRQTAARVSRAVDSQPVVRVRRSGGTLEIALHRPEVHNAIDARMRDALCAALDVARSDADITHVLISGDGGSFCSGGDLAEFGTARDPVAAHLARVTRNIGIGLHELAGRDLEVRVHGACVGAGVEIAAFGRRVIAAAGARFALPEVGMGLIPGAGGTVSIPRRIGRHRTAWLALTDETIDATTALEWRLVDAIEPEETSR